MSVRKAKRKLRAWEKYYTKTNCHRHLSFGMMSPKITDGYRKAYRKWSHARMRNARRHVHRWTGEIARVYVAKP